VNNVHTTSTATFLSEYTLRSIIIKIKFTEYIYNSLFNNGKKPKFKRKMDEHSRLIASGNTNIKYYNLFNVQFFKLSQYTNSTYVAYMQV